MKYLTLLSLLLVFNLISEELKVKANLFEANQNNGISVFKDNVNIVKGNDELNASEVTIYSDDENQPTKFVAEGNVTFSILTKGGLPYYGKAEKVVFIPKTKEYYFYKNVHLKQLNEKKEIIGDEVVLKTMDGTAYAKGAKKKPVIMIFDFQKDDKK